MRTLTVTLLLMPSLCLAYNPSVKEILSRMETMLRRSDPVLLQVIRETPDASRQHEIQVTVPADLPEDAAADDDVLIPFSSLTLPLDTPVNALPSLFDEDAIVKLDRFGGTICYLLEGRSERLWLRKNDLVPLKVESLSAFGKKMTYVYLDHANISEKSVYPSRTEILQDESLVMVEHLVPARARPDQP